MRVLLLSILSALLIIGASVVPASAEVPQVWEIAVLRYGALDAVCNGVRVTDITTAAERDTAEQAMREFKQRAEAKSDGNLDIRLTFMGRGELTQVSRLDPVRCWPSEGDIRDMGDWPSGYDTVYVLHAGNELHGYLGLGIDPYDGTSATYATMPIWERDAEHWYGDLSWNSSTVSGLVHEWLHGVHGFYRWKGYSEQQLPDLHSPHLYGYSGENNWAQWYNHYLGGDIETGSDTVGLERFVWSSGSPTTVSGSNNDGPVDKLENPID